MLQVECHKKLLHFQKLFFCPSNFDKRHLNKRKTNSESTNEEIQELFELKTDFSFDFRPAKILHIPPRPSASLYMIQTFLVLLVLFARVKW